MPSMSCNLHQNDLFSVFNISSMFKVVREFVDGADLEALMKNPSLCPALKCPEKRIALAVGKKC